METEQSLGDDEEASNMAASRNGSIADLSRGKSDDDHAAMIESLDLNPHAEGMSYHSRPPFPLKPRLNETDRKGSMEANGQISYSFHPLVNPKLPQEGGVSGRRSRSRDSNIRRSRPVLKLSDYLEQRNSSVQTNVLPPISNGMVYLCRISCKPAAMPAQEKRMLIKEYLQCLNIIPCLGRVVFLNGHTFMTKDLDPRLNRYLFHGSFCHRGSRFDEKSKLISNSAQMQSRVWSNLDQCKLIERPRGMSKFAVEDTNDNLNGFEASASCTVETLKFSDLCSLRNPRDLKKYNADLNNLYSPGLPTISPGAPEHKQIVVHGNRTFDFRQAGHSLGFGLEARDGALLIVRATEKGLVRVVTPCQRIFFAPIKVSSFMTAHLPVFALDPIKAAEDFDSILRGLHVVVRQANGVERRAIVSEVSRTCPSDTVFEVFESGVQTRTTVQEYFSRRACSETTRDNAQLMELLGHEITLTDLTLPCLNVGSKKHPQYFPGCLCYILPGQSFRKKMPIQAIVNLHRAKQTLLGTFEEKGSSKSNDKASFAKAVDLIESTHIVQARSQGETLLDLSRNTYETLSCSSRPQSFKLSDYKLSVQLVFAEIGNTPAMSAQVVTLLSILKTKLESSGNSYVIRNNETCKLKLSETKEVWRKILEERLDGQLNDRTPMVIAMIAGDNRNKKAYETVKSYLDVDLGFQSTCVNLTTLEKAHKKDPDSGIDKYASSLLRKILTKTNTPPIAQEESTESNGHQGAKSQFKTLLVGFHLAHLPPKLDLEDDYNEDRPLHSVLLSVATKPLGLMRSYKTTTVIQNIENIVILPTHPSDGSLLICTLGRARSVQGSRIPRPESRAGVYTLQPFPHTCF